jgi:hypothetical protein
MTRPNKLEGLSLETISSQVLELEGKARANPIGAPFRSFLTQHIDTQQSDTQQTVAYLASSSATKENSFITSTPDLFGWRTASKTSLFSRRRRHRRPTKTSASDWATIYYIRLAKDKLECLNLTNLRWWILSLVSDKS